MLALREDSPGARLKKARKLAGRKVVEVAQYLGRSRQTVYNMEADPGEARVSDFAEVCTFYGTSMDVVVRGAAEPQISAQARKIATEFDALPPHLQKRWLLLWQLLGRRGVRDPVSRLG
jgi:transcriptional regulator with XRE-family HTH domain